MYPSKFWWKLLFLCKCTSITHFVPLPHLFLTLFVPFPIAARENKFLPSRSKVPLLLPAPDREGCISGLVRQKNRTCTMGAKKECLISHVRHPRLRLGWQFTCNLGHSLLLLPRGVIYYFATPWPKVPHFLAAPKWECGIFGPGMAKNSIRSMGVKLASPQLV